MVQKIIAFTVNAQVFELHTQLRMVRRVGNGSANAGYWSGLDKQSQRVREAAENAQKLKECLL